MKQLLLLLSFVGFTSLFAQTEYYSTDGKNRLTEEEIAVKQTELKERFTKVMKKEMFVSLKVKETVTKPDSIIYVVGFDIGDKKPEAGLKKSPLEALKGNAFPAMSLQTLSGEAFDPAKLNGKPTLINFWFTRCAPCIDEMPVLNKITEEFKDEVNFVAVTYEKPEAVTAFLKKHAFEFEHLVDGQAFINELGIQNYPQNLFLDKEGKLQFVEGGIAYNRVEDGELKMGEGTEIVEKLRSLLE